MIRYLDTTPTDNAGIMSWVFRRDDQRIVRVEGRVTRRSEPQWMLNFEGPHKEIAFCRTRWDAECAIRIFMATA